jgi:hypothetical protein
MYRQAVWLSRRLFPVFAPSCEQRRQLEDDAKVAMAEHLFATHTTSTVRRLGREDQSAPLLNFSRYLSYSSSPVASLLTMIAASYLFFFIIQAT